MRPFVCGGSRDAESAAERGGRSREHCYLIKIRSDQIRARHGLHSGTSITRNSAYSTHHKDGRQRQTKRVAEADTMKTKNPQTAVYGGLLQDDDAVDNG